jgi:citrate lyase subunit beta / citryl-CoA lyase
MVRSYLFVPGNDPVMLTKAWSRGADALIVDLEDAVPHGEKVTARRVVARWLQEQTTPPGRIWVRVNNDPELLESDLAAATHPAVTGIVVPKVRDAEEAQRHATAVAAAAAAATGTVTFGLLPMIETPRAMLEVDAIASVPGVVTMMIGEYDFAAELGIELTGDGLEMLVHRARLVLACAAAGIDPPVAPVHIDFRDLAAYEQSTTAFRRLGFVGRAAIHPAQVAVANAVFTPSEAEMARAERLLELHAEAIAAGRGVGTDDGGRLLDEAVVRSARRIVELGRDGRR